ncbi:Two-pore potassium channel 5 [Bienertia sinuspersici]
MEEDGDTENLSSQPLLSSSSQQQHFFQQQFQPIANDDVAAEINSEQQQQQQEQQEEEQQQLPRAKPLHRCKTAPAIDRSAVFRELKAQVQAQAQNTTQNPTNEEEEEEELGKSGILMVRQAGILLVIYLLMGVLVYGLNTEQYSKGVETHPIVDALYFCIVTMCTIGYGDITPLTPFTKIFACIFVLIGFGFIDTLLSGVVNYILDVQEQNILSDILHQKTNHQVAVSSSPSNQNKNHNHNHRLLHFLTLRLVDVEKGRMRIRLKVCLALSVLVFCIGIGALFLYFAEDMSWVDSVYLSALSVTTVGYGDRAFNTLTGRLFASVWLLVSTLAVARAFLYLVEARIHKRQRTIAKWVLQRDVTPSDLFAANINNNDHLKYVYL